MSNHYHYYRDRIVEVSDHNSFSPSILKHLRKFYPRPEYYKVVELGCGVNPLVKELKVDDYLGIDISFGSIELNKRSFDSAEFISGDITQPLELNRKYDVVLDSHLLHCLTSLDDRRQYYHNVKNLLDDNGDFIAEVLCYHSQVEFPFDYMFDGDVVYKIDQKLSQNYFQEGVFPYRWLPDARDVEAELIAMGFKIEYFLVRSDLRLDLFPSDRFAHKNWPMICQFRAKLNHDLL